MPPSTARRIRPLANIGFVAQESALRTFTMVLYLRLIYSELMMALYGSSVEYGLHCLLYLADASGEAKASSAGLAEFQGLSPSYVAKLFTQLKNAGLVVATEGSGGGYQLARAATDISVFDVVQALPAD
jgi:hypothetical protein